MVYINTDAVVVFLNEMNMVYLVSLSTIVNILLNFTSHAKSFDVGNFVMKFMVTDSHAHSVCLVVLLCHIFYLSESCSVTWIASDNVLQWFNFKVADIVPSLYEVLSSFDFKVFTGLWHTCISSSSVKRVCFTLYIAAKPLWGFLVFTQNFGVNLFHFSWSGCLLKVSASSFSFLFL
jgi:hypothetical protein